MGICVNYTNSRGLLDVIGGHFSDVVVTKLKRGYKLRLIGDNLNFKVHVHDMRMNHQSTMMNMFASAILIQPVVFNYLPQKVEIDIDELDAQNVLPSKKELNIVRQEYIRLICDVVSEHIPMLSFARTAVPKYEKGFLSGEKSTVVPLPVLPYNEQYYDDDVKILEYYEDLVKDIYQKADIPLGRVHTGGDQLTRERFSHAKRLRLGNPDKSASFQHLGPITAELFHLDMNFLEKVVYRRLYNDRTSTDLGTMKSEKERIQRQNVNPEAHKSYDASQQFFLSFVKSYVIEMVLHYLGMDDVNSTPRDHSIPPLESETEMTDWLQNTFADMLDEYVFKSWLGNSSIELQHIGKATYLEYVEVKLSNGILMKVPVTKKEEVFQEPKPNNIFRYASLVLELGLMYMNFLDICKKPSRERMLRMMKLLLVAFKANNNMSKYALEVLRFLVQQIAVLEEREATEVFYGLFVNNSGKPDCYIRADMQMEFIVREQKKHIKHMYSTKQNEDAIKRRSKAVHGLTCIAESYDHESSVLNRTRSHADRSSTSDEQAMLQDLRKVKPFQVIPGRSFVHMPPVVQSITELLDKAKFGLWVNTKKYQIATEYGQW